MKFLEALFEAEKENLTVCNTLSGPPILEFALERTPWDILWRPWRWDKPSQYWRAGGLEKLSVYSLIGENSWRVYRGETEAVLEVSYE